MGTLLDLLPFLEGWEYNLRQTEVAEIYPGVYGELLPPSGIRDIIFAEKELGWLIGGGFLVVGANAEQTWLTLRTDNWVWRGQIVGMQLWGMNMRGIVAPYLTRYDTVNNIYGLSIDLAYPLPYKSQARVSIENPGLTPLVIGGVFSTIRIKPEAGMKEKFLASLKKVLGTDKIAEMGVG